MDHEVEQHVDVERTPDEDAETLGLDVTDIAEQRGDRDDRRVVTFDVADLNDALARIRDCDQALAVRCVRRADTL
ncbi:MAG TPA: hypothetical protein VLU46_04815 [Thermoanaerobaculia bacterium]|nr:hypothetical protein [Thermoanaerobaculia bacterium]